MAFASSQVSLTALWLIAMVVFLIVEAAVPGLVSIWFALGALAAVLAAMLRAPVWLQVVWFFVISIAALALTRPLAKKYVNGRVQPTNADRVLGRECVVRERIDSLSGTGAVTADGKVWSARMRDENECAEVGEIVIAREIQGVKLLVEKKPDGIPSRP